MRDMYRDFPDSMTQSWDATKISDLLVSTFTPHLNSSANSSNTTKSSTKQQKQQQEAPTATIDALITFDASGVSSHPNHISLYHGARTFIQTISRAGWASPVDLYTLTSVPVYRKYAGFVDALSTLLAVLLGGAGLRRRSDRGNPSVLVSMSSLHSGGGARESYGAARRAMTDAHQSQMVWFRWGWIALSRYMYINDLRLERVK